MIGSYNRGGPVGYVSITNNSGYDWERQLEHDKAYLRSGFFLDDQTGWAVGAPTYILKTENGGKNWTEQYLGSPWALYDVHFASDTSGCIVGNYGIVYFTKDGGSSWQAQSGGISATLNAVFFLNDSTGWAVGDSGAIIGTTNPLSTALKTEGSLNIQLRNPMLEQNFPNPFNSSTRINYYLPTPSEVSFTISNIYGQKVRTFENAYKIGGSYHFYWDGKNDSGRRVSSGIYLYRLQTYKKSEIKKMILLN